MSPTLIPIATTRLQLMAAGLICLSALCATSRGHAQSRESADPPRAFHLEPATGNLPLEIAGGLAGAAAGTMIALALQHPLCVDHGHLPGFCSLFQMLGFPLGAGVALALPATSVLLAGAVTGGEGRVSVTLLASACVGLVSLVPALAVQSALHEPRVSIPIIGAGLAIGSVLGYRGSASLRRTLGSSTRVAVDVSNAPTGASAMLKVGVNI